MERRETTPRLASILRAAPCTGPRKTVCFQLGERIPERQHTRQRPHAHAERTQTRVQLQQQLQVTAQRFGERDRALLDEAVRGAMQEEDVRPILLCVDGGEGEETRLLYVPVTYATGTQLLYWLELLRRAAQEWQCDQFALQHTSLVQALLAPAMESSRTLLVRLFDRACVGALQALSPHDQWNEEALARLYRQRVLID